MAEQSCFSECFKLAETLLIDLIKYTEEMRVETSYYDGIPQESMTYEYVQHFQFSRESQLKILLSYINALVEIERTFLNRPKSIHGIIRTYQCGTVEYFVKEEGIEKPQVFVVNDEGGGGGKREYTIEIKTLEFLECIFERESFEQRDDFNFF